MTKVVAGRKAARMSTMFSELDRIAEAISKGLEKAEALGYNKRFNITLGILVSLEEEGFTVMKTPRGRWAKKSSSTVEG